MSLRWITDPLRHLGRNIIGFFTTRVLLKIMSLLLGTLLWFAISATDVTTDSQYVNVRPNFTGEPAEGYELERPVDVEPKQVFVRGRIALLDRLLDSGYLHTKPISLEGKSASRMSLEVEVDLLNVPGIDRPIPEGNLTAEPSSVVVEVVIYSRWEEGSVADVPVQVLAPPNFNRSITFLPDRMDLYLLATRNLLDSVGPNDIKLYIDVTSLSGVQEKDVLPEIVLPEGMQLASPLKSVHVTIGGPEAAQRKKEKE